MVKVNHHASAFAAPVTMGGVYTVIIEKIVQRKIRERGSNSLA